MRWPDFRPSHYQRALFGSLPTSPVRGSRCRFTGQRSDRPNPPLSARVYPLAMDRAPGWDSSRSAVPRVANESVCLAAFWGLRQWWVDPPVVG